MDLRNCKVQDYQEPLLEGGMDENTLTVDPYEKGIDPTEFLNEYNEHMYRYIRHHKDKRRFYVHG
jgi:hypothetical protein